MYDTIIHVQLCMSVCMYAYVHGELYVHVCMYVLMNVCWQLG